MPNSQVLSEVLIDEIGTQTLARLGLNIFSLNTFGAYGASVTATNIVSRSYDQHKNNKNFFGQTFEDLDVGQKNILSALRNNGQRTYTTDELADIRNTADILSGKKYENLNDKDKNKFDFIMRNYPEEVSSISSNKNMQKHARKNDPETDTVTFDKDGNVLKRSQLKVIKNTDDLLQDRYLENNDSLTMPFDDYKKHKANLEKMIASSNDQQKKEKAIKALAMLDKNNVTNRLMCENPRSTAVVTQSLAASGHIAQAGLSDAIVVSLSTLANGAVFEIKDAFSDDSNTVSISTRIKRLLEKVLQSFREPFSRGASFGALDVGIGILTQIFKSISSKLTYVWRELRTSLKSIFNAVWDFFSGKIKTYKELISIILKALFSASMVVGVIAVEAQLEAFLAPLVSPVIASFLAPALSITVGAIAVVLMSKSVDLALNALFGVFAQRDIAKMKAEEVKNLCADMLPTLIDDREKLESLIKKTYQDRKVSFNHSFNEFKNGFLSSDIDSFISGLQGINSLYGKNLSFSTFSEFDEFMLDKDSVFEF